MSNQSVTANPPASTSLLDGPVAPHAHVVIVEHRHGADVFVCATRDLADQAAAAYVRDNWAEERARGAELPARIPRNDAKAVADYFEEMNRMGEWLSITQAPLIGFPTPTQP